MLDTNNQKGTAGEKIAVEHLLSQGYKILSRNWRYGHLELDIIAQDGKTLVIVEVKLRASNAFGTPQEFVTRAKQKKIIKAAGFYIREHNIDLEIRFDVVSVIQNSNELSVEHIKAAFYPGL